MKFLLSLAWSLFFLFAGKICFAQEILLKGTVLDSLSGEPVLGAVLFISPQHHTTTDVNGKFILKYAKGSFSEVKISALGYSEKKQVLPDSSSEILILLDVASRMLDPVVISSSQSGERQVLSTVSIQSIQPYLIQNRVTTNMQDAIAMVPGVNITDGQANIRSGSGWSYGTGSRVAVMVDGMPMMGAGTGQVLWNYLPLENVEQVEIIKGASSVLYGSSALNGVINIRTRWPGNKSLVSASLFSGVYDAPRDAGWKWQGNRLLMKNGGHLLVGKGTDRMQYVLSTHLLKDDSYRMGDKDNRARVSLKTRFYSKDKTLYGGINGNVMMARTGSFLLWENYSLPLTSLDSEYTENKSGRWNIDPYLVKYSGKFIHHLNTRVLWVSNRISGGEEKDQSNVTTLYYSEYRLESIHLKKYGWLLNTGAVASYGKTEAGMFSGTKMNSNLATYLQGDYQGKRLTLSLGARYEQYRLDMDSEGKPVFKAGAGYRVGKASYFRVSAGQGYRFPVVAERYIRTSVGPVYIYPNGELKSEFGTNAEIGFRQVLKLGAFSMLVDAAIYRMQYENMMEFSFGQWEEASLGSTGFGFKSVNIGKTRIDGAEISIAAAGKWKRSDLKAMIGYNFSDPVNLEPDKVYASSVSSNLTYKNTSSDSSGTILKYRNRHLVKCDLQWEQGRWSAGTSYRYTSSIEAVDKAFEDFPISLFVPGIKKARADFSKGGHVFDLRTSYLVHSDYKVTFMVANIFNSVFMTRPADIRPPRTFTVQLSYRY